MIVVWYVWVFFFFKQKTAYEMRISDWSSDVCSSDLAFAKDFPERIDEYEVLLTDNRIWKQRTVGIGVIPPEKALAWGMTGPMLRGSGVLGPAQEAAVREVRRSGFRYPRRRHRRLLRPLPGARGRDAPVGPDHRTVRALAEGQPRPGHARQLQGVATIPRGDEGRHGSADPPLQSVLGGLLRSGRRDLLRGRGPQGDRERTRLNHSHQS